MMQSLQLPPVRDETSKFLSGFEHESQIGFSCLAFAPQAAAAQLSTLNACVIS